MKKVIALILLFIAAFLLLTVVCFGQNLSKIDTIRTEAYTSYFSDSLKEPLFVSYKLYHGGGDCSRKGMSFKSTPVTATKAAYAHSGYDIGHLCNAEDKAADCAQEELTFRFYNALPQMPNLNRGIWKVYEDSVRRWSQSDSLLIICGGTGFAPIGKLNVPEHCWKVVYSLTSGQLIFCGWFTNLKVGNTMDRITPEELELRTNYKLPIQ